MFPLEFFKLRFRGIAFFHKSLWALRQYSRNGKWPHGVRTHGEETDLFTL